jgi:ankyrin repeat protein
MPTEFQHANAYVHAAQACNEENVRRWLDRGLNVDALNDQGATALYEVAGLGYTDLVRLLLEAGANPNIAVIKKNAAAGPHSALNRAIASGAPLDVIDLLLKHGANPRIVTSERDTAVHLFVQHWRAVCGLVANHIDRIRRNAETRLMERAGKMLDLGVPINQVNGHGRTVLGLAIGQQTPIQFIAMLLERGADAARVAGESASGLHIAAQTGQVEVMQMMIAHGVPVNLSNDLGQTPLFNFRGAQCRNSTTGSWRHNRTPGHFRTDRFSTSDL